MIKQDHRKMIKMNGLTVLTTILAAMTALPSCVYDHYDGQGDGNSIAVEVNIRTRAINSDSKTYEQGTTWENYVDFAGGDYRIYFFTNDKIDATATDDSGRNTLIAEFVPTEITSVDETDYTQYTIAGEVGDNIVAYSDFKVVVLANWGTYPTVTAGTTTIDALVEGDNTTFNGRRILDYGVREDTLIPFYGVREYSGVKWMKGLRTTLNGDISLLRAVAKIEVILTEESDVDSFSNVQIVAGCNSVGYCAPKGVYLKADYDHDGDWYNDFVPSLHLYGGKNERQTDLDSIVDFHRQSDADNDTWVAYMAEFDNTSSPDDYATIRVYPNGTDEHYYIHFANYTDGEPASNADYDIFRNYLYRFYVTYKSGPNVFYVNLTVINGENEYYFNNESFF